MVDGLLFSAERSEVFASQIGEMVGWSFYLCYVNGTILVRELLGFHVFRQSQTAYMHFVGN